ncbi:MAG: hypothetical protein M3Z96_06310 [Pseudomonadota bacterium]|nr:hypothetical protein [Pseudomonadota bacterium]
MTLALFGLAFLAGLGARLRAVEGGANRYRLCKSEQKESLRRPMIEAARLVAIGVPALRKRLTHLQKQPSSAIRFPWHWSIWRRHHHAGANHAADQKRPTQFQL